MVDKNKKNNINIHKESCSQSVGDMLNFFIDLIIYILIK